MADGSHWLTLPYWVLHVPLREWQADHSAVAVARSDTPTEKPAARLFSSWAHCSRNGVAKIKFWRISLRGIVLLLLLLWASSRLNAHWQVVMQHTDSHTFCPHPFSIHMPLLKSFYGFLNASPSCSLQVPDQPALPFVNAQASFT